MATEFETHQTAGEHQPSAHEGTTTRMTESVTAQAPSGTYLSAAVGAMAVSAGLQLAGKKELSLFVGQWAPAILVMGLYNKLVKVAGSD